MSASSSKNKGKSGALFGRPFTSEALLQQAIAGLLVRMPDISSVQILQGTQEFGKDIIFSIKGGFGERLLCACVIKNTKITGDAGKVVGARTVFLQAQQAFDTPHTEASGTDTYVERVYIITPFDLTPSTISSIKGKLKERSGQIVFIDGAKLLDLFKQYWPDFLADEADAIERHFNQMSEQLEGSNPLIDVASQYNLGNVTSASQKIYVSQVFHREVYSAVIGDVLANSLPTEISFYNKWTRESLRKAKTLMGKYIKALHFLLDWEFCNQSDLMATEATISQFSEKLETAWREGVEKETAISYAKAHQIAPDVEVMLNEPKTLLPHLREVVKQREIVLLKLDVALAKLDQWIAFRNEDGLSALSDSLFIHTCSLSECVRSAAEGIFVENVKRRMRVRFPKDILHKWSGHLMIVGAPGFGKTSFCRWNALQDIERFNSGTSKILPVYIPLHKLARRNSSSFKEMLQEGIGKSALLPELDKTTIKEKEYQIRFYLDGLDEVPSEEKKKEIIDLVRADVESNQLHQIILTARDHVSGNWLNWMFRLSLSGFDRNEIKILVKKWLGKETDDYRSFFKELNKAPILLNLMRTPLLANLIILVFRQTRRLPENKTKLYEIFIDLLTGGWDISKGILRESKFGQRIKMMTLAALAGRIHAKGRRDFGDRDIKAVARDCLSLILSNDWESLRQELIVDGLVSRGADTLQFSHLSFQEFLTAKDFMGDPERKGIKRALTALLQGDEWWREVVRFYIGLSAKPRELTRWLLNEIERIAPSPERVDDLLSGVMESFPEFPIEEMVGHRPQKKPRYVN